MDAGRHCYRLTARRLLILRSDNSYEECIDNNKMTNDSTLDDSKYIPALD